MLISSVRLFLSIALLATLCLSEEPSTAWKQSELIEPSALARALDSSDPPYVVCVADPVSYRARHIAHAIFAGPGGKPEGIDLLKAAASALSKDDNIVIYCSCCPLNKCPNVRPAYTALKQLGFSHVRVLDVMTNIQSEWYRRGYPSETGAK
jgi:thiosulfate/3-mercaptopyruvate sulfurtransferase